MSNDPRERADQDLWLRKAQMNLEIKQIQDERGPIQPTAPTQDQGDEKKE